MCSCISTTARGAAVSMPRDLDPARLNMQIARAEGKLQSAQPPSAVARPPRLSAAAPAALSLFHWD
jgi:hypothetical protein